MLGHLSWTTAGFHSVINRHGTAVGATYQRSNLPIADYRSPLQSGAVHDAAVAPFGLRASSCSGRTTAVVYSAFLQVPSPTKAR